VPVSMVSMAMAIKNNNKNRKKNEKRKRIKGEKECSGFCWLFLEFFQMLFILSTPILVCMAQRE